MGCGGPCWITEYFVSDRMAKDTRTEGNCEGLDTKSLVEQDMAQFKADFEAEKDITDCPNGCKCVKLSGQSGDNAPPYSESLNETEQREITVTTEGGTCKITYTLDYVYVSQRFEATCMRTGRRRWFVAYYPDFGARLVYRRDVILDSSKLEKIGRLLG